MQSSNLGILNTILASENVVEEFYKHYANEDFKQWLLSLLPEVEACRNQPQDNPWHIYNCLDHILHSVEEMNKLTTELNYKTRRLLAYTMFYHDLGKPTCHIRRYSKLYKREVDSFFNHNEVSYDIAYRTARLFNFTSYQRDIICHLVRNHDIFMFITLHDDGNPHHQILSYDLLQKEIDKFYDKEDKKTVMQYLIMVGRADNLAQNSKMTNNSLQLLNTMEQMLKTLIINS